jgi:hypothetical protein
MEVTMHGKLWIVTGLLGTFLMGCAKKVPVYDEANNPITEREIRYYQNNNNFVLYTLGGGALSFGASFFIGTLVDRAMDNSDNVALWATTGAGTLIGTLVFANQGKKRDRNQAIEYIKDKRKRKAAEKLTQERARQQKIEEEISALEKLKQQQEAERKKLLEEVKKKKGKPDQN